MNATFQQFDWIKNTVCSNHSESTKPNWCFDNTSSPVIAPPPTPSPTSTPNFSPIPTTSFYPTYDFSFFPTGSPVTSEPTVTPEECPTGTVATVVKVRTDDYFEETSWEIKDSSGTVVLSRSKYAAPASTYYDRICLDQSDCYSYTIYDTYGDGIIFGGFYEVFFNGDTVAAGDVFEFEAKAYFGECDNVNPCGNKRKKLFSLQLETDNYGSETSWKLQKRNKKKKKFRRHKEGGVSLFELYLDNSSYIEQHCLQKNACYRFKIFDSFGDGMCCKEGDGGYKVTYGSKVLKDSKFEGVNKEMIKFGKCKD